MPGSEDRRIGGADGPGEAGGPGGPGEQGEPKESGQTAIQQTLQALNCPDEWIGFGDFCYKANFTEILEGDPRFPRYKKVTWYEGQKICKDNENSRLPVIYDEETNEFINSKFVYNDGFFKDSWIGALTGGTNTWEWQDGYHSQEDEDGDTIHYKLGTEITDLLFSAWHNEFYANSKGCAYINGYGKWLSMEKSRCGSTHLNDVRYLVCQKPRDEI